MQTAEPNPPLKTLQAMQYDMQAPFFQMLDSGVTTNVGSLEGSKDVPRALVLLTTYTSMMRLKSKGIQPCRGFRVTDVKNFFGVKGSTPKVLEALELLKEALQGYDPEVHTLQVVSAGGRLKGFSF